MQEGADCLQAEVVGGHSLRPRMHASASPPLPCADDKLLLPDVMYTDTPRLVPSPSYSAMSASPAMSATHSPTAAEAAAAQLDSTQPDGVTDCLPITQIVWEADCVGTQQMPAVAAAHGRQTVAAVATLISPGASCYLQLYELASVCIAGWCSPSKIACRNRSCGPECVS